MSKVKLKNVVSYSKERSSREELILETYITTDNLLQNKSGVSIANGLPNNGKTFPKYRENEILISNIRPYLKKIWFSDREGICSADVLTFSVNPDFNPKFVYYSMFQDDFFEHAMKGSKGTKMPRGDKNQILEFEIPRFQLPTQQKNADILSALDDKIELNNKINDNLERIAKMLYDYWFVQFDFPDKNGKPYKSSGGKMIYNNVLKREIPENWEVENLYSIADFINGLACQKFRPNNKNDDFLPVIKIREMNDGISVKTEKVRTDIPAKYIIDNGDILFSWSATLDVKVWTGGKGALNQHIFKISSSKFPKTFYFFELVNYLTHFKMMAELRKTTMGHITIDHLQISFISIPERNLIYKMNEKIEPILQKQISLKIQNQQLSALRDWLLPMLMNRQVKVE